MINASKSSALLLVLFIAISSLTVLAVKPADAQSIPNPSVPQFSVQFVNASYGVSAINPYTGENQTQQISNCSIQITIKNQPLNASGNYQIYYGMQLRPHFEGNWTQVNGITYLPSSPATNGVSSYAYYITGASPQSNDSYTIISFPVRPTSAPNGSGYDVHLVTGQNAESGMLTAVPIDAQLDFQVEALVGHNSTYWALDPNQPEPPHCTIIPLHRYLHKEPMCLQSLMTQTAVGAAHKQ